MVCYSALVAINNDMSFDSVINQINQHADNSGFIAALDEDLYEPRPNQVNLIKAILLRLDMEQQDESVIKTYTGRITIEHILPQALVNEYWINRFQPQEHVYWLLRQLNPDKHHRTMRFSSPHGRSQSAL